MMSAFDGQLQRSVGKADSGMANVGECLAIAEQITPGDRDSWYRAWSEFAGWSGCRGDEAAKAGYRVSARGVYFRAAEYFARRSSSTERTSMQTELQRLRVECCRLPVRARIARPPRPDLHRRGVGLPVLSGGAGPFPTILHIGGYDGTAEELFASVPPALDRGYAFAAIDGPGQGAVLYDQRVSMRPDWENVVPEMFDAVAAEPEVDAQSIVLVGRSFGGVLAPRGAAGEDRLVAMIVDPGQFDIGSALLGRLGPLKDRVHDPAADEQFQPLLEHPAMKALFEPRMTTHGVATARAYCEEMLRYSNAETVTRITCPTFVTDNETDVVSTGQGKVLYDHLTCPKEFRLFTKAEGAEGHCEGMASTIFWDAAYNWLDTLLTR